MAITVQAAEHNGFEIDRSCYPWIAYKGPRFDPDETHTVVTPAHNALELQVGDVDRVARGCWDAAMAKQMAGEFPFDLKYQAYRRWARTIIDQLLAQGWEVTRTTPRPLGSDTPPV